MWNSFVLESNSYTSEIVFIVLVDLEVLFFVDLRTFKESTYLYLINESSLFTSCILRQKKWLGRKEIVSVAFIPLQSTPLYRVYMHNKKSKDNYSNPNNSHDIINI